MLQKTHANGARLRGLGVVFSVAIAGLAIFALMHVLDAAILPGFASHTPAGIGVFDAAILLGLGGEGKGPPVGALLPTPARQIILHGRR